jgi:hypothetical protein
LSQTPDDLVVDACAHEPCADDEHRAYPFPPALEIDPDVVVSFYTAYPAENLLTGNCGVESNAGITAGLQVTSPAAQHPVQDERAARISKQQQLAKAHGRVGEGLDNDDVAVAKPRCHAAATHGQTYTDACREQMLDELGKQGFGL